MRDPDPRTAGAGIERLRAAGIEVLQTAVGDRYVLEAMREGGYALGGEQSGHVVMLDHQTTGDGVLTALHLLARVAERAELSLFQEALYFLLLVAIFRSIGQRRQRCLVKAKGGAPPLRGKWPLFVC